jgi:hypothetical protein
MKEIVSENFPHDMTYPSLDNCCPNLIGILALASEQFWPYLRAAGLPEYLVSNPQIFLPLYEDLRHRYCVAYMTLQDSPELVESFLGKDFDPLGDDKWIRLKLWHQLLEKLEKLSDQDVAMQFDRWARRHWFSGEVNNAINEWKSILLSLTASLENQWLIKVPLPDFIRPMLPELRELVSCEISRSVLGEFDYELVEKSGMLLIERDGLMKDLYDQWSSDNGLVVTVRRGSGDDSDNYSPPQYYTMVFRPYFECVAEAIIRDGVFQALRLLANHLSPSQQKEFISWAESQAEADHARSSKELCGSAYLRTNFPFYDSPSLLTVIPSDLPKFWNELNYF